MIGHHRAHIINLRRDARFHTNATDLEAHDIQQLLRLIAALRAVDVVNAVERVPGANCMIPDPSPARSA